jgi:hypothetical protein
MKIAIVTLGIGDYWKGCKVLLHSLERHGLPDTVDRVMLYDPADKNTPWESIDFATTVPVLDDYSDLPFPVRDATNRQRFINSFKRVAAFTLPYDRIIYMDADMLCVGDPSLIWGDKIGKLPFYACRDTAAYKYYPKELYAAAIDPQLVFNGGLEIMHPELLPGFYYVLLCRLRAGTLSMYDGADQGAFNSYFQFTGTEVGLLPQGLNYVLDPNMPVLPEWERRIIHFCSSGANPWTAPGRNDAHARHYYELWEQCWKECLGEIR